MLYALISDIHSNLEALEAVLQDAEQEGAQAALCLGDIVGYGAEPHACIERIRQLGGIVIAGNHDYAVCGKTDVTYFNTYARQAIQWTIGQLSQDDLAFLAGCPLVYHGSSFCLVHGSLNYPDSWEYLFNEEDAIYTFRLLKERILFIGHSHVPLTFTFKGGEVRKLKPSDFILQPGLQYIVNVGSVGQPRDTDVRASYCLFDDVKEIVRFRRVPYHFQRTQAKILNAGLPEILALRLQMGR